MICRPSHPLAMPVGLRKYFEQTLALARQIC
jgi:hypothetical protein